MNQWQFHVLLAASYLLGSIPAGLLLARLKGVDIRKVGSGNIGATNVFRSVGKGWGIATFVFDALKGFMPAFLFPMLLGEQLTGNPVVPGLLFGCAAIAGHNWPVFLGFKGGKGVATSAGFLLGVAPTAVGIGLLAWIALFAATRYVSVASIAAAFVVPAYSWAAYDDIARPAVLTVLGLLVVWRHRSNIRRLLDGTENRFKTEKR